MAEEPPAKRIKIDAEEVPRDDMLNAIFHAWDRDGSGAIEFEEILPHYMKSTNHQEDQEHEVRQKFDKFMKAHGKDTKEGIAPDLFRLWLGKLDDARLSKHYERHVLGKTDGRYGLNVNKAIVKEFEGKTFKEVLDSPISAIQGLAEVVNEPLAELGLKTVRDLGSWRFYQLAHAIVTLAEKEDAMAASSTTGVMNMRDAMDRDHEGKSLKQILKLPPSAFNMFPAKADAFLKELRITTIEQLGSRKTFAWASAMVELEKYEAHVP